MEDRYLYRAKRTDNGEWVEGFYVNAIEEHGNGERTAEIVALDAMRTFDGISPTLMVDPSTICQCTGLKDKNGKLIWENDICDRKNEYPEIVKYHDGDWTLDYSYASNKESGFNYCNLGFYVRERKCVEVIGNIFDNLELLEVGE